MNKLKPAIVLLAAMLATGAARAGDGFERLHARWQDKLTGGASLERDTPEVARQLRAGSDAAQGALTNMRRDAHSPVLWDDLADFTNPKGLLASAAVTSNARRLQQMAVAYAAPGSASFHDAALGLAIIDGLERLVEHHYRARRHAFGNWWDWQIGTPLHLLDVLCLMDAQVPPALQAQVLEAVSWYVPDPRWKTRDNGTLDRSRAETGANLLDKAMVAILGGMLARDAERIALGRDTIGATLDPVRTGDGFYRDGSFIQHDYVAYTGNYGAVALADLARLIYLLSDSAWPIAPARMEQAFAWARAGFVPWIVDGAMPDALRGRKVSARTQTDHGVGRGVIATLALLAESGAPAERAALRAAIKGWMTRDRSFGASYLGAPGGQGTAGLPLYELGLLKAIAGDTALAAAPETQGVHLYPSMDRAIMRGPGFSAVLSLTSARTTAFEFGNGENLQGWWTGMGMLAIYDADQTQFGPDYWATVDLRRLPGTSTDHSGSGRPVEWQQYPNTQAWVGGAALGKYAVLGMDFTLRAVTGSGLQGKKSWFMLGERILALGFGIGQGQQEAETVVENRKLSDASGARLLVDGKLLANGHRRAARWAHLEDGRAGSQIGYVFPQGADIATERMVRSGQWRQLNDQQSDQEVRHSFQSLVMAQGSGNYAYVLLPNASAAQTQQAARAPGLLIEANDNQAAAVRDTRAGLYAANLWRAGSAPRAGKAYVTSSGPAAVLVQERGGRLHVVVADPTEQQEVLVLSLAQPVGALLAAGPGVTVLETAPHLRLQIDTRAAAGASFEAQFASGLR
ncbi:MAG: polysaccharide lyase 8 family protein [Pseudomonadota bacterium]